MQRKNELKNGNSRNYIQVSYEENCANLNKKKVGFVLGPAYARAKRFLREIRWGVLE